MNYKLLKGILLNAGFYSEIPFVFTIEHKGFQENLSIDALNGLIEFHGFDVERLKKFLIEQMETKKYKGLKIIDDSKTQT